MKQILALFCLTAALTTPLWLLCAAEGVTLGCCWAQGLLKACWPSHLGCAGTLSSAALQGEQLHLKPGHQPAGKSQNQHCACHSSAPAHDPPEHLLLMNFSRLYTDSWGSSLTDKPANHFKSTRHICFSRLKQEESALKCGPSCKWEL